MENPVNLSASSTLAGTPAQVSWTPGMAGSRTRRSSDRRSLSLHDLPSWLLLVTLVVAPWAYGSTRPLPMLILSILMLSVVLGWGISLVVQRRRPAVAWYLALPVIFLVLQGWWMAFNARAFYDKGFKVLWPGDAVFPALAGSVDASLTIWWMMIFTGLGGIFLFVVDRARHPEWRRRLWMTAAITGASIALGGVILKLGGESLMSLVWDEERLNTSNNFALYRYRGNAASFLNIVLPLLVTLLILVFRGNRGRHGSHPLVKTLAVVGVFLVVAGIQLNPSRAGWGIALALIGVWALLGLRGWWKYYRFEEGSRRRLLMGGLSAVGLAAVLSTIILMGGWETGWQRASQMGVDIRDRSPTEVYRQIIPDAGWFGYGPGTFQAIFATYQTGYDFGDRQVPILWKTGRWKYAHQDYYQAVIEWGYLGALILFGLVAATVGRAWLMSVSRSWCWQDSKEPLASSRWLARGIFLALGATLIHALIDFPFQVPSILLYLVVLAGILWAAGGGNRSTGLKGQKSVAQG